MKVKEGRREEGENKERKGEEMERRGEGIGGKEMGEEGRRREERQGRTDITFDPHSPGWSQKTLKQMKKMDETGSASQESIPCRHV